MESLSFTTSEPPELPRSKMRSTLIVVLGRVRSRATRRRKYSARDTPSSLARWRARRCISASRVIWVRAIMMYTSYHINHCANVNHCTTLGRHAHPRHPGSLNPAEACRLSGYGQCLERRKETTSLSSGTAGLVAAAHPASDPCPSGNRQRLPESGGDCSASAQWLEAVRTKTGQRSDHRLPGGKIGHSGDSRSPRP